MAASEDDAELAELRSAVLASFKSKSADTKIEQASLSQDENSSQAEDDEDLEVLRLAALQTKKLSAFTGAEVMGSPQQSKRDDKFSRFESDSDSDNEQSQSESSSDEMEDSGNQSEKGSYRSDTSDSEEDACQGFSRENKDYSATTDADMSTGISSAETILENKSPVGDASQSMNTVQEEMIAEALERSDKSPAHYVEDSHISKTSPKENSPCKNSKDDRVDKKCPHSDVHRPLSSLSPGKENLCGHTKDDSSSQRKSKHTSASDEDGNSYSESLRFNECSDRELGSSSKQTRHPHSSHNILDRRKHEVSNNLQRRSHSQSPLRFCGREKTEGKTYSRERSRSRSPLHAFHLTSSRNTFSEDDKGQQGYDLLLSKKNAHAIVIEKEKEDSQKNRYAELIPLPDEATLAARRRKFECQEVNVSSAEVKRISLKHIKLKREVDNEADASVYPVFKENQDGEKRSIEKKQDNCSEDHSGRSVMENLSSAKDNGIYNDRYPDSDDSVQRTKREKSFEKRTNNSRGTDGLVDKRNEFETYSQRKELDPRKHDLRDERDINAKMSRVDGKKSLQEKLMSLAYGGVDNDANQMEHFKNRDEVNENKKKSLKHRLGPLKEDCKKSVSGPSREHERTFNANDDVPYDPIAILKSVINDKKGTIKQTSVQLERYRHRMEKRDSVPREDKVNTRSQSPDKDDSHAKSKRREGKTSSNMERKVLIMEGEEESLQKRLPVHLRIGEVKQHITVKKTFDCLVQQSNSKGSYQTEGGKQKQQEEPASSEGGSWEMSKRSRNNEPVSGLASQISVPHRKEKAEAQKDVSADKESELDERIRKIQEKNAEILRRKQEIEADKKKYG
ncbi:uncharacterized protein LOC116940234 isoform X2 [Petromyzon marinus]|uniref:Dentin sialophosphoprotein-like isoform X2 n=1 Tax=Petromyzon marinus TaxID=7757 RepID=A0AAJ7SU11_PETMA|nr:dentin sialophosphoprotein-like isoform X2 [Petromyzon marinus]